MNPCKFIKAVSETYFAERDKISHRSRRWWSFTFIAFFALFLFQIYAAYMDWQMLAVHRAIDGEITLNLDEFWRDKTAALRLQGLVLFGILIRFSAAQFRSRWSVRIGEAGEMIAFAAFYSHCVWTREAYANQFGFACSTPILIGLVPVAAQGLSLFFLCWVFYKLLWIIAVTYETVRKYPQCPTRF